MAHHDEDYRSLLKRLLAVGRECEWLEFKQGTAISCASMTGRSATFA